MGQFEKADGETTASSRQPVALSAWMEDAVVPSGLGGPGMLQLPGGGFLTGTLLASLLYTALRSA